MTLHPSVAAVRLAVRRVLVELSPGDTVLVACSGGADSLALASAAVFEGRKVGLRVAGVTVDHGLQPDSAAQADQVVAQLAAMGVDETLTVRVHVEVDSGLGPEAAARQARHAVLAEVGTRLGASAILLGHTLDDQAETVLLGLTRGSGARSLAGMRPAYDLFVRPLLGVRRLDTLTACQLEGLQVWHDPHNDDPAFTRVRVRRTVLPMLEAELGPGVAQTLARTAEQLREDTDLLDTLAEELWASAGLDVAQLASAHVAIRRRALRLAAVDAGCPPADLTRDHVLAIDSLVVGWRGQKWIDLPGGLRAVRRDGVLGFVPATP